MAALIVPPLRVNAGGCLWKGAYGHGVLFAAKCCAGRDGGCNDNQFAAGECCRFTR